MNSVNLIGRLTKDAVIRYTNSGLAIAEFSLAIDRPPNKDGEKQTDFPRCKAFGGIAETIERFTSKGKQVGITGEIQTGSYEHKDGYTVYTTDVIVRRLDLLGGKTKEQEAEKETIPPTESDIWQELDEDIPF